MTNTKEGYEYKTRKAKLQMSLFHVLYRHSASFTYDWEIIKGVLINRTEWGKLKNRKEILDFIKAEYFKKVNETLDWVGNRILSARFGDQWGPTRTREGMLKSYEDWVYMVMTKLKMNPSKRFSYYEH